MWTIYWTHSRQSCTLEALVNKLILETDHTLEIFFFLKETDDGVRDLCDIHGGRKLRTHLSQMPVRFNYWILVWWHVIWFLSNTHWINPHSVVCSGLEGYQQKYPDRLVYDTNQNPIARPRMSTKDGVLQTLTTGVSGLWSTSHQRCIRQIPRTYIQISHMY